MLPDAFNGTSNVLSTTAGSLFSSGENVALKGSHFHDALLVIPIAMASICAVAFAVLSVLSWRRKSASEWSQTRFAVLTSVMVGMFIGYIRSVADGIVHELRLDLPRAYLVIPALKPIITNVTDVTLIGLIYLVVENRLLRLKKPGDRHFLSLVHKNVVAVILILLALGDTVSCIYAQVVIYDKTVEVTESTGTDTTAKVTTLISGPTWYRRIHLAYATVYFAIALEIMACALYMHLQSSRALRSRILTHLLILISPALIIRAATIDVLAVLYVYLNNNEPRWVGVLASGLWDIPSIFIYTGLILIQYQKDWDPGQWSFARGAVGVRPSAFGESRSYSEPWKEPFVSHADDPYPSPSPPLCNTAYQGSLRPWD